MWRQCNNPVDFHLHCAHFVCNEAEINRREELNLHDHFDVFRQQVIGHNVEYDFDSGRRKILYADWAASGRLYRPIEEYLINEIGPFVANTHTETTLTGRLMTDAYHQAHQIIKKHVGASQDDQLLFAGFGMTAVINKFQRILGLRVPEKYKDDVKVEKKPLVIITHMEHHSNQTSWAESLVDMAIIARAENGLPDLNDLSKILEENKHRDSIIGSFTACSNVTGILTPYHEMAELIHQYGGVCFVDFSASAPYVSINMHPENEKQALDAIFFSPHKFLGGPGSSGVIVFNKKLYHNRVPDHPGGGTVSWTNPWGGHAFFEDIEAREDGGTPGFLQAIKVALSIRLKEKMGVAEMLAHEKNLKDRLMDGLQEIASLTMLEAQQRGRIGFVSFYVDDLHHNLIARLLNDRFGVQTRGGCSCAGTYGHVLLNINYEQSRSITDKIDHGDLSQKPGWVRISLHPTMTEDEVDFILDATQQVVSSNKSWIVDYKFDPEIGDFEPKNGAGARLMLETALDA